MPKRKDKDAVYERQVERKRSDKLGAKQVRVGSDDAHQAQLLEFSTCAISLLPISNAAAIIRSGPLSGAHTAVTIDDPEERSLMRKR